MTRDRENYVQSLFHFPVEIPVENCVLIVGLNYPISQQCFSNF